MPAEGNGLSTRKAKAEATRRRLLDVAVAQFAARPYDEVAVADIAEAAGVAHGLVFHHFQNKRGIYLEAMRAATRQLEASHSVSEDAPAADQIREMLRAHLAFMADHSDLAIGLIRGGIGADPEAWEIFETDRWKTIDWLCALIGLDPNLPALRLMLRSMSGAIDEATVHWINNGRAFDIETVVEALMDMLSAAMHGATRLEPTLDVAGAIKAIEGRQPARSRKRPA